MEQEAGLQYEKRRAADKTWAARYLLVFFYTGLGTYQSVAAK